MLRDLRWYTALDRFLSYGKGDPAEAAKRVFDAVRQGDPQAGTIVTSTLGADSVALGAVRLALDHVETELFSVTDPLRRHLGVRAEAL